MSTITPLPTPPSRQDPANFSDRADDFLGALPLFATEANTVAGEVNTNALNASTSASTATTQAGIATTQAGIATTQAGIATNAAIEAEGLIQSYQGSLASDPSLNKEGGPLTAGDWYINSTTGFIRAYDGSVWVQGVAATSGVISVNGNAGELTSEDVVPALSGNAGKVLKVNDVGTAVEWGIGVASGYQEFTSSGTWVKPAEATWVYVEAIGGGGGGGVSTGGSGNSSHATGGGGGGFVSKLFRALDLTSTVVVTIGAGGAGSLKNSASLPTTPGDGGNTTFGSYLKAKGGGRGGYSGNYATIFASVVGGLGGSEWAAPSNGNFTYSGYASGTGGTVSTYAANGGNSVVGGAGGGGAVSGNTFGTGGVSDYAGNGGDATGGAVGGVSYTASNGSAPGGGGGAVSVSATWTAGVWTGGAGGNGRVRVWWW